MYVYVCIYMYITFKVRELDLNFLQIWDSMTFKQT